MLGNRGDWRREDELKSIGRRDGSVFRLGSDNDQRTVIKSPQSGGAILVVTLHPRRVDSVMIGRTGLYLTTTGTTVTGVVSGVRGGKNNARQIRWIDTGSVEYRWRSLVNNTSSGIGSRANGCRGLRIIVRSEIKLLTLPAVLSV